MKEYLFMLLSVLIISCGGVDKGPGKVTIDGKEVIFKSSFMIKDKKGGYMVQMYNHDKATCKQMLGGMRTVPSGEISFRAYAGRWKVVGSGAYTEMGATVEVLKVPKNIGDIGEIAVGEIEFKPTVGRDIKGKNFKAKGIFKGKYCGVAKY